MKVVKPSIEVMFYTPETGITAEQDIEDVGRTCYKSHDKVTETSAPKFVKMLRNRNHAAMLEFGGDARVRIVGDRGLTHELVRHRLASFAQESTRYCNYSKGKFQSEITVIEIPGEIDPSKELIQHWHEHAFACEKAYLKALDLCNKPEIARMFLPIGLKAEIVMKADLREWRHVFSMRCSEAAHPIIRGVMMKALKIFAKRIPEMFMDLAEEFIPIAKGDVYVSKGLGTRVEITDVIAKPGRDPYVDVYIGGDDGDTSECRGVMVDMKVLLSEWIRVDFGLEDCDG